MFTVSKVRLTANIENISRSMLGYQLYYKGKSKKTVNCIGKLLELVVDVNEKS